MENLIKYTAKLIAQHDCVILPGLGAFLAHNVPAYYDAENAIFMPPQRTLVFNPQINVDDALLVSEYMYAQQLNYNEAAKRLRNDILSLRRELSTKGSVCFSELGTFSINVSGKISFTAIQNGIDSPLYFGFEPLVIKQLKDVEKKEIIIRRTTLRKAVSAVAAIIIMFLFVSPIGDSVYDPSMQAGFVTANTNQKAIPCEEIVPESQCEITPFEYSVNDNITNNVSVTEVSTEFTSNTPVVEDATIVPDDTNATTIITESEDSINETFAVSKLYSIIVASTPNEDKAQLAIEELSVKAEASYTVVQGSGRYRIAYSTYNSNQEAMEALSSVKKIFPDAWIFTH